MKSQDFVNTYKPYAFKVEEETGIPAVAILAQAALESGWGAKAIGNNLFGIKWKEGDWGKKRVLTPEYNKDPHYYDAKGFVSRDYVEDKQTFKFMIYDDFADYPTPLDGFKVHAKLLLGKRYLPAMDFKHDPKEYLKKVWECGYATDPAYAKKMGEMVDSINRRL